MTSFIVLLLALTLSPKDAGKIADKIWINEGSGKAENLICWNKGENFASLGIGHFIWLPKESQEPFEETFPQLMSYLESSRIKIPTWLKKSCPWTTREEFYKNIQSSRMMELKNVLIETKPNQAAFMVKRLEESLPQILNSLPKDAQAQVKTVFYNLASSPQGLYALIDYLNFKGSGLSSKENYKGQGWGLKQVLATLSPASKNLLQDFADAAKKLLTERVQNAPPDRHEEKWLKGWTNRLNTYLTPL